ncbi:alkylated DNA repair protein (DNA oxidative demethylase) [Rhodovulum iodosum]|uniref:Alkylated DNA repair protein (DNA oxidative demethylase) n=1 Tax=Rhodovulum iodosum TaxID=68291 RepID=A0ABV3XRS4_9RHOB|nr:alpha-ketoglutarate-dependent dioxygenase AlkB [Rhodovulum robiginosum]RSK30370.1 alpha-ketoglutarate-dependent dioxygenase AlkB [Rhodovulum robiginosum]
MTFDTLPGTPPPPDLTVRGVAVHKAALDPEAQRDMVTALRDVVRAAPFFQLETRFGRKLSVRMSAAGAFGWFSDRRGYRYIDRHPSGAPWPPIPECVLDVWRRYAAVARLPECCLINHYGEGARMGLHQDRDEADFRWPVLSISLGDSALFRLGNLEKGGPTESLWLESGDVLVMGGASRLIYHGIDRVRAGSSTLLDGGGRLNLTLRVVT